MSSLVLQSDFGLSTPVRGRDVLVMLLAVVLVAVPIVLVVVNGGRYWNPFV